jgi:hypothetical protein
MGITTVILAEVNKQRVGIRNATEFVAYGSANLLPVGCEFFGRGREADDRQSSDCSIRNRIAVEGYRSKSKVRAAEIFQMVLGFIIIVTALPPGPGFDEGDHHMLV